MATPNRLSLAMERTGQWYTHSTPVLVLLIHACIMYMMFYSLLFHFMNQLILCCMQGFLSRYPT